MNKKRKINKNNTNSKVYLSITFAKAGLKEVFLLFVTLFVF